MTENAKKFLEAISQNEEERKEVSALKTKEEVIAYAKGKGFTLTDEDFEQSRKELSDDELDAVAGGIEPCSCSGAGCGVEGIGDGGYCGCSQGGFGGNSSDRNCPGPVGEGTIDTNYCACLLPGSGQSE